MFEDCVFPDPVIEESIQRLSLLLDAVQEETDFLRSLVKSVQCNVKTGELHVDLASRRKTLGLTQAQLAEKVSVTRSAVAMWETGAGNPRFQTLPVLAEALGCTVDELVSTQVPKE